MRRDAEDHLVGLDLNATRARASGGVPEGPRPVLAIDGGEAELPLAISLEARRPEVGRAGTGLARRAPHLACLNYLTALGTPRTWAVGRHRLDAERALGLVFERLQPVFARAQGLGLALPAYLRPEQAALVSSVAERVRLRILGAVPAPLAAAFTAYADHPWGGVALVGDVDEHALTWTAVQAEAGELRGLGSYLVPALGLRSWKERLLQAAAERCIRRSRRDPRDCPTAEQALYEQIDAAFDACRANRTAGLTIQADNWFQDLVFTSQEILELYQSLARQALAGMEALIGALELHPLPGMILLTAAADRMPGLSDALSQLAGPTAVGDPRLSSSDFGEELIPSAALSSSGVHALPADAQARAAHALAVHWHRGELPPGPQGAVPLPAPLPADAGLPRLHFQGRDFPLRGPVFSLGRHPDCDLVLDPMLYPSVSTRHCEIVLDRRAWTLRDRSRNGTYVNNRPVVQELILQAGDWIRLGAGGPLLRFLGQTLDQRPFITTA